MRWRFWRRQMADPSVAAAPSLAPSFFSWVLGKRMLSTSLYVLPSDVAEEERLNLQHFFYKLAHGGNTRVPLRHPRSILDVACGTGIWPREMAQEYPSADVWGFDINMEPLEEAKRRLTALGTYPQNFHFRNATALEPFPFEDARFDFTHARLMSTWLPMAQYPQVVAEMLRVTRPGGYLELVDFEVPSTPSRAATALMQAAGRLLESRKLHNGGGAHMAGYLRQAGAVQVQERRVVAGIGRQRVREQRLMVADLLSALRNMGPILVKTGMLTDGSYQQLIAQAEQELPQVGMTYPIVAAYGMRKLSGMG